MKKAKKKKILPIIVATLVVAIIAAAPAMAKSSKKSSSRSSAAAAASSKGSVPKAQTAFKPGQHDNKPGPAWKTIGGTVKHIETNSYLVEDYEGNRVKLYVGQGTKHLNKKKVGDTFRAEITRGGFANSIQ
jgi:ribosomal protein L21E